MGLPGVETVHEDARSAASGPRLRLSRVFLAAELTGGVGPFRVRSSRELERQGGARTADTAPIHDWVAGYFRRGGSECYVAPLRGPAAATADVDLVDGAAAVALTVTARSPGTDGNRMSVDVDVSGTNFTLKVFRDDVLVETSPVFATGADAAEWTGSRWVTIADGAGGDPAATASPTDLTGGDDDFDGVTDTELDAALATFSKDLGPGSIVLPGRTSATAHASAAAAAAATNRIAKLDAEPTGTAGTLTGQATAGRATGDGDYCDLIAPRVTSPGLSAATSQFVPGSVIRCAAEARNDAAGVSPNQPAAGRWGTDPIPGSAPEFAWDDSDLETLNDAGVNVIRVVDDELKLYGARTLADPNTDGVALSLGSARLRMAITEIARYEGAQTAFEEIDQGGAALGNLRGRVEAGVGQYARSLYFLAVAPELVEGDAPGDWVLETTIEFQAAPNAERVRMIVSRQLPEIA